MSYPEPAPIAGAPAPTCGACGARVSAADVTCPACGVLLAAYQAPVGAAGAETSATRAVPSPAMSSPMAPLAPPPSDTDQASTSPPEPAAPRHRPRSQSPIGDALRRSREDGAAGPDEVGSAAIADELARMATSDSALAREVEAELTGAKVTFDGAKPVIESEQVDISHTTAGAPVVSAHAPTTPAADAKAPAVETASPANPGSRPTTRSVASAPVPGTTPPTTTPPAQRPATTGFDPATLTRWLPFILIGCAVLAIGRSLAGVGALLGIVLVIGLVYLLVKVASASSRKTTTMPRDESWKTKPPRPRK